MSGIGFSRIRPRWRFWVALAGAVVVLIVLGIAQLAGGDDTRRGVTPPVAGPDRTEQQNLTPGASRSPAIDDDSVTGTQDPSAVPRAANQAAIGFVTAWAAGSKPGTNQAAWLRNVGRYADPTLTDQLKNTDPSTIESSRTTGPARGVALSVTSVQFTVPTDAGDVLVLTVKHGNRWLVATVTPADEPSPSPSP